MVVQAFLSGLAHWMWRTLSILSPLLDGSANSVPHVCEAGTLVSHLPIISAVIKNTSLSLWSQFILYVIYRLNNVSTFFCNLCFVQHIWLLFSNLTELKHFQYLKGCQSALGMSFPQTVILPSVSTFSVKLIFSHLCKMLCSLPSFLDAMYSNLNTIN